MLKHLFWAVIAVVALTSLAGAQNPDPNTWPATFNGNPDMGPYAWVDGPSAPKTTQGGIVNGVVGGQEGTTTLFVCRGKLQDGVHPGKFFTAGNQGICNIGWGGVEKVLTSGYEVLVNTQPQNAKFLSQTWVSPTSPEAGSGFQGGAVGDYRMRVAQASYNGGIHPGKEWHGKCNIGWGGQEIVLGNYQILVLGFDKAAWQAAQISSPQISPIQISPTASIQDIMMAVQMNRANILNAQLLANIAQLRSRQEKIEQLNLLLNALSRVASLFPASVDSVIDYYNSEQIDPNFRKDPEVLLNGLKINDPVAQTSLTQILDSCFPNTSTGIPDPNSSGIMPSGRTKAEIDAAISKIQLQIQQTGSSQQADMVKLQSLMDKQDKAVQLMTTFLKRFSEAQQQILNNVK